MRIMVADQAVEHRNQVLQAIEKWGHTLEEALSGREVVEQCRKKCPDLIFIDLHLSGQSGVDVIRQIRQTGGHAVWVPIILTGKTITDSVILQGAEAGADDVLQTPLNEARLKLAVLSAERHLNLKEEVFKVAHDLVVANRALQSAFTQDVLTGIASSNSFEEALEREWFSAKNSNHSLTLILLNLDFFQEFNQTYGAEAGDKALRQVAEGLKQALPMENSFLARTTGATFAVLLPKIKREKALQMAEKLHKTIDHLNIPHTTSGCSNHLTASVGVAVAEPEFFTTPWDLKDAADYGLYQAKHSGYNKCVLISATETIK